MTVDLPETQGKSQQVLPVGAKSKREAHIRLPHSHRLSIIRWSLSQMCLELMLGHGLSVMAPEAGEVKHIARTEDHLEW